MGKLPGPSTRIRDKDLLKCNETFQSYLYELSKAMKAYKDAFENAEDQVAQQES